MSFKAVSVERRGHGGVERALQDLFYHLLVEGVRQEHARGRAELPRLMKLFKDREDGDALRLANLQDRVQQAAHHEFDDRLTLDKFEPVPSDGVPLIQAADLFASSLNRVFNHPGTTHKRRAGELRPDALPSATHPRPDRAGQ